MAHRAQYQEHRQDMDDWELLLGSSHWELVPRAQAISHSGKWRTATMLFLSPQPGKGHTELRRRTYTSCLH